MNDFKVNCFAAGTCRNVCIGTHVHVCMNIVLEWQETPIAYMETLKLIEVRLGLKRKIHFVGQVPSDYGISTVCGLQIRPEQNVPVFYPALDSVSGKSGIVKFCKWLDSQVLVFITVGMVYVWFLQESGRGEFSKDMLPVTDYGSIWNHSRKFPETC